MATIKMADMLANAAKASQFLQLLGNERRLLVLCLLVEGERPVTWLAEQVGLSPSALSQHLARLRADGLVATRRDSQTIFYRLADARTERLLSVLHELFCATEGERP